MAPTEMLEQLIDSLRGAGIDFVLADVPHPVFERMRRSDLAEKVGQNRDLPHDRRGVPLLRPRERHALMAEREVADASRRSRLANERTYLAWLRTGLAAVAIAVATGKIVPSVADVSELPFELLGGGFALLGLAVTAYGARRFVQVERALDEGSFAPLESRVAVVLAGATCALALAALVLVFVR